MSAQLSKMHVRFIQSQKNFFLFASDDTKGQKLPIAQIYVKDNSTFYLVNQNKPVSDEQTLRILFNE